MVSPDATFQGVAAAVGGLSPLPPLCSVASALGASGLEHRPEASFVARNLLYQGGKQRFQTSNHKEK